MSYTFTSEQMQSLQSLQPNFHAIIQQLEKNIAPQFIENLKSMQHKLSTFLEDYNTKEEYYWEVNYKALSKIAMDNNLKTVWSIKDVPAFKMNDLIPHKITSFNYDDQQIVFDSSKNITWLQAWKAINHMILLQNTNHIFIENFDFKPDGRVIISTGS